MDLAFAVTHKANHLGMVVVSHNHCCIAFFGMVADNCLDAGNFGTCGINDFEPCLSEGLAFLRRNTVGPDDDPACL